MKTFLTGATGFIGNRLLQELLKEDTEVHVLLRKPSAELPKSKKVRIFYGDLTDRESIRLAMTGCDRVYHVGGHVHLWSKDPEQFYKVNVEGTRNVAECAMQLGVSKMVYTSTCGVYGPSNYQLITEKHPAESCFVTDYDSSKLESEKLLQDFCKQGLKCVIVQPSRVYGPGFQTESNAVTKMIRLYLNGQWRFVPGDGNTVSCYVFVDDVVKGHMLAMRNGRNGERYILGGENATYLRFFKLLAELAGVNRKLFNLPKTILKWGVRADSLRAKLTGGTPRLSPAMIDRFVSHRAISSEKAIRELAYTITPLEEGFRQTLNFLKHADEIPAITNQKAAAAAPSVSLAFVNPQNS
ncbi:MAG: NAD-dependent epimerase/dehydratase family protein [Bacteroidetes bacterium]|nr:NAD-dependent epimerase/dehydratase family protein [Bacteroidota bacterium]